MQDRVKLAMQVFVSAVLLLAGLYVLLVSDGAGPDLQKFAAGWIGLVAGYWLK